MELLQISEIVISILLVFIILIQNKNVTLSLTSMSGWDHATTKRWAEKVLHNATIILGTLFIINSIAFLVSK